MKVCDKNNSSLQRRRGAVVAVTVASATMVLCGRMWARTQQYRHGKGDCCNGFCNGVSRQWSPVGWKPNPKQNETRRSCWAGRRRRWAGQRLHWVDRHNQLLLRLPLTEQRVGKTQREVEIKIRLGLSGRVTVGFYRSWRGNWRDETREEKDRGKEEKNTEECSIKGCSLPDAFPQREENVRRRRYTRGKWEFTSA